LEVNIKDTSLIKGGVSKEKLSSYEKFSVFSKKIGPYFFYNNNETLNKNSLIYAYSEKSLSDTKKNLQ
jgi:hypothetical protein